MLGTSVPKKRACHSMTCWGGAMSIASALVALIVAKTHLPPQFVEPIILPLVCSAVGGVFSILGRLKAKFKIGGF